MNKIVEFLFQSWSNPVRNWILGGVQGQFSKKMGKKNRIWGSKPKMLNFVKKMNKIVEFLFQSGSNPVRNWILGGVQGQFPKKIPKKFRAYGASFLPVMFFWHFWAAAPPQVKSEMAYLNRTVVLFKDRL